MTYAVLLRGVNVGGVRIAMEDLRLAAERRGFAGARTLLNSGNLLVETDQSAARVKTAMEEELQALTGQPVPCLVRSLPQVEALLQEDSTDTEGFHHYLLFCERPLLQELEALYAGHPALPGEALFGKGQDIHWKVQKERTLEGFGSKVLGSARFKALLTSRNLRTAMKIRDGLRAMEEKG